MSGRSRQTQSPSLVPIYLCLVALGSIAAHLASEFFAMGSDAGSLAFSPKHLYLGIAAFACMCAIGSQSARFWRASSGAHDVKRLLNVSLVSLPWRGRGTAFFGLTAGLQLCFGLTTLFGEGCAFCGHDIAAGLIGALLTAVVLALAGRAIAMRLPAFAAAIATLFADIAANAGTAKSRRGIAIVKIQDFIWFVQLYNRPPPPLSIV